MPAFSVLKACFSRLIGHALLASRTSIVEAAASASFMDRQDAQGRKCFARKMCHKVDVASSTLFAVIPAEDFTQAQVATWMHSAGRCMSTTK